MLLLEGSRLASLGRLTLALDGKTARQSGDHTAGTRSLHLVSARRVLKGLTLA